MPYIAYAAITVVAIAGICVVMRKKERPVLRFAPRDLQAIYDANVFLCITDIDEFERAGFHNRRIVLPVERK